METWYRVKKYYNEIKPVKVVRELPKTLHIETVFPSGKIDRSRVAKENSFDIYFPSWAEAHEYLLMRCNQAIVTEQSHFELALRNKAKVEDMTEPMEEGND